MINHPTIINIIISLTLKRLKLLNSIMLKLHEQIMLVTLYNKVHALTLVNALTNMN